MNRRNWIKTSFASSLALTTRAAAKTPPSQPGERDLLLAEIELQRVLDLTGLDEPILLSSVEILKSGNDHLVRIRDQEGNEGISVANPLQFHLLIPMFRERIVAPILGRDLREWEKLIDLIYLHQSNYKLQGMALWQPLATLEFAVLDLLGKLLGKPIGALFGPRVHDHIAIYEAFGDRESSAEKLTATIASSLAKTKAPAIKFKLGGRMSRDRDCLPGRSEKLPALLRKTLGDDITLYSDANGSYSPKEAIRIGKFLQDADVAFFEEPCRFDHFLETKQVADALEIPIAGGEQDSSTYNLRWSLANDALQVIQPDIFYFGGMVRSMKIARMAAALGVPCTPHMSGGGLGHYYLLHFLSSLKNAGSHHEYKGTIALPVTRTDNGPLNPVSGKSTVPTGPGLGLVFNPDWLAKAQLVAKDSAQ